LIEKMNEVKQETRLPLRRIPSGRSGVDFIGVEVQSRERPLLMLVDTGTSLSILRESVREEVRLKKLTQGETVEPFAQRDTATVYSTSSLFIGGEALGSEPVTFLPDERFDGLTHNDGSKIDGILGATLLARGEVEFDALEMAMRVRPFRDARIGKGPHTVPLLVIPDLNGFTVPLETEDGSVFRFILDTGTNADLILAEESDLGKKAKELGETGSSNCRTLRGENLVGSHPLPVPLQIAGHRFERGATVFVQPSAEPRFDGSLGIPIFWASERVILNREQGLVSFEPRAGATVSFLNRGGAGRGGTGGIPSI
jgi:hypothetical protein